MAVRTAASIHLGPAQLMHRLNGAYWSGSQTSGCLGLNYAALDTYHGVLQSAQCGAVGLIAMHRGTTRVLDACEATLGSLERLPIRQRQFKLSAGDVAVIFCGPSAAAIKPAAIERIIAELTRHWQQPAAPLAALVGAVLNEQQSSCATLVVRRNVANRP